jgi:uncharacterized membrane protein
MADRGIQLVLGTFSVAFLYCLIVLRSVHGLGQHSFVPHMATTVGVLTGVASVGVLIYFIHHVSTKLQIEELIDDNTRQLVAVIERVFTDVDERKPQKTAQGGGSGSTGHLSVPARQPSGTNPKGECVVAAPRSGYVQTVDLSKLVTVAVEHDLEVEVLAPPGTFVVRGEPVLQIQRVAPTGGRDGEGAGRSSSRLDKELRRAMQISVRRTTTQDPLFAVEELVEIAVRALSPSVNAPYTAIICVDRLSGALSALTRRSMPSTTRDENERVRARVQTVAFRQMVEAAFQDIRRYGNHRASTMIAPLDAIGRLGRYACTSEQHAALLDEVEAIVRDTRTAFDVEVDPDALEAAHRRALHSLARLIRHDPRSPFRSRAARMTPQGACMAATPLRS